MSPEQVGAAPSVVIALQIITPGAAGLACLRAARRSEDARRGWALVAVFCAVWALAGAIWGFEVLRTGSNTAYPSLSDVLYLVGSVPLLAGVVAFPSPTTPLLSRRRLVLDVAVLATAITAVTWVLQVGGATPDVVLGTSSPLVALTWIGFDSLVIAVVLVHGMREWRGRRLAWAWFAVGVIAISAANSYYYWLLSTGGYEPGHAVDWAWVAGFLLVAVAASRWPSHRELRELRTPVLTRTQEAVPYAALVAAVVVGALVRPRPDAAVLGVWIAVGVAAVARRAFLVDDHVRVTNDLQRRASQQTAVAALAQAAVAETDHTELGPLLDRACQLVAEALEVPLAKVDEVQDDGDLLVVAGVGWEPGVVGEVRLPGEPSWRSGYALRLGRPVTSDEAAEGGADAVAPVLARHGVVGGVSVPIGGRTTPYGVLSVHTRVPRRFHPEEVEFLQFVADIIGNAVERAEADRRRASAESELQQLTWRLQAAVRMYSLALESGGMGVWEYDVAADRITPSRKVAEFYGTRVTSGGRTFADACEDVHPDDRNRVRQAFHEALECGQRFTCEYRFARSDGAVMWVQAHARVERDEQGRARRVYGVTMDVTEHKRAEQELQLRDRHLRQAQKMESLGQLAGGVAHDFNNLLTAILGNVELVEARLAPAAAEELGEVRTAAQRAKGLVQQLLAFSRLQPHTSTVLDVGAMIEDLSDLLVRLIGSHIEVCVSTPPAPAWVQGDRVQLQQVVLNLATNARDAMPTGGRLEISTEVDEEQGVVRLVVRDSGEGMPPEVLSRMFEPFYTTKPEGKGTGMGMAVVYGVVVQNDGHIDVTSEPGDGTTVVVTLPYVADGPADAPDGPDPVDVSASAGDGDEPSSPVVLAVEDQPQIRALITTVLESRGHRVHTAGDGMEALEVAAGLDGSIDVLITDVVMPRLNGPDLASRLMEEQPDLRVLYISGYTRDVVLDSSGPCSAFLQKPFSIAELVEVVESLLEEDPAPPADDGAGA